MDRAEQLFEEQQASSAGDDSGRRFVTDAERPVLERFVFEIRHVLEDERLDRDDRADAEAQIATIDAQMKSPRPQRHVIRLALHGLKRAAGAVVDGTLGNAAYAAIVAIMSA